MESCSGEIYVHHLWGYYFFLPGISFFPAGRWHLPHEDVHMLLLTIRRWAVGGGEGGCTRFLGPANCRHLP